MHGPAWPPHSRRASWRWSRRLRGDERSPPGRLPFIEGPPDSSPTLGVLGSRRVFRPYLMDLSLFFASGGRADMTPARRFVEEIRRTGTIEPESHLPGLAKAN